MLISLLHLLMIYVQLKCKQHLQHVINLVDYICKTIIVSKNLNSILMKFIQNFRINFHTYICFLVTKVQPILKIQNIGS